MKRISSILALSAVLASSAAVARPPVEAFSSVAALPSERLMARLREEHTRANEALATRKARHAAWQEAVQARDQAAAEVERRKRAGERGADLEGALRRALHLDEAATVARSRLLAAEAEVARRGADLLRIYDAVLTDARHDIEALPGKDPRRAREVRAYQGLAEQRDQVRRALSPVLGSGDEGELGLGAEVRAAPHDDIETLLEKADLARDLEERFLRRAALVRRRIAELEEEQALARDVANLVRSQSLFDEEQRRLVVVTPEARPAPGAQSPVGGSDGDVLAGGGGIPVSPRPEPTEPTDPGGTQLVPPPAGGEAGFGAETIDDGARQAGADVVGAVVPQVSEQVFFGSSSEVDLSAQLASGRLTLPQLRALEKKLREEAERLRKEGRSIRSQAKERAKSR